MTLRVKSFQPTPNPNAVKCVLDRVVSREPLSYRPGGGSAPPASGGSEAERLAAALLGVPGVVGVLLNSDWVTVNKSPGADWGEVKAGVKRALAAADE
jgi:hypothetical protein